MVLGSACAPNGTAKSATPQAIGVASSSARVSAMGAEGGAPGGPTPNGDRLQKGPSNAETRYYQVVFLWTKDPAKFGRYLELATPVVDRYGGALERMLMPDVIYAEGVQKPDIVNIVYYDSREAFHALHQDPDFKKIVHLRSESVDLFAIDGAPLTGAVSSEALNKRLYLLEVAKLRAGLAGYRRYEEQADPVMSRYGYHVERVMSAEDASGFSFRPDIVKVAYFDEQDGMERMHKDPEHGRIENDLYPSAVEKSVWVIGRVHPLSMGPH